MKLTLKRRFFAENYTVGSLFVDGVYFCDTLENKTQSADCNGDDKTGIHQTSIPCGIYQIVVNPSLRFGRNLPRLIYVPNFEGVLIHRGTTAVGISGCILVGENKIRGQVINSTYCEIKLTEMLLATQNRKEQVEIEIV